MKIRMAKFWVAIIESCELNEEFPFRIKLDLFCKTFIKTLNLARKVGRQCLAKNCIKVRAIVCTWSLDSFIQFPLLPGLTLCHVLFC